MGRSSGCVAGTLAAALHYQLTAVAGAHTPLVPKFGVLHLYDSDMAQNFWGAIWAWTTCFVVTIAVSMVTRPKPAEALVGLVYGLTPQPSEDYLPWYRRPAVLGMIVLVLMAALNVVFW